jgi:hypothetical protein
MASQLNRSEPGKADLRPLLHALTREDDGAAANAHLTAGRPIYYGTLIRRPVMRGEGIPGRSA